MPPSNRFLLEHIMSPSSNAVGTSSRALRCHILLCLETVTIFLPPAWYLIVAMGSISNSTFCKVPYNSQNQEVCRIKQAHGQLNLDIDLLELLTKKDIFANFQLNRLCPFHNLFGLRIILDFLQNIL